MSDPTGAVLLRDVIDIPERVGSDDYVLKLTDSTDDDAHIRATLDEYVLTDSLRANFLAALDLISDAVSKNASRAAFLTGSFGSGKSHFMAVLYALLGNHPAVRSEKFTELTGRYDEDLAGKKILRLTYHLIGAKSMEEAVFGGYIRQIRRLHPGCELPALHVTDKLLDDAEQLRARMGDEKFLEGLGGEAADDAWGGLLGAGAWDLGRYRAALAAPPEDPERRALVTALVENYFTSFTENTEYLELGRGLSVLSAHAETLGYDAVLLFLDELVLWLIFWVQNSEFFAREAQKMTTLVEDGGSARAIPLVSLISRQMDLRKWFADAGTSGAEQDAIDRAFQYQEGRFAQIQLGDDNLAQVAHARLLRPKNAEAAAVLERAFQSVSRTPEVWDVLRDSMNNPDERGGASEQEFRLTYPFSPALVATLRNLSAVMQRERTALKVMQKMLVDRRDTLTVDDLIPVGDVFDYVVAGNQPIDQHAGGIFSAANELYTAKLLPALCEKHEVGIEQAQADPTSLPRGFVAHERIAKTLLLSAIAPKVPALQDMTAARLAALNHGSIKARMRGGEARMVLGVVRDWANNAVPEITVSDGANPVIRVKLSDVDYQSILDRINAEDNPGRRRVLLRRLVHDALGITAQTDITGAATRTLTWRGSKREVDVVFGNVRDPGSVPDAAFAARPDTWRFLIDYPFDEQGYTAADDIARIDRVMARGDQHTIAWLPRFFSTASMEDLALLVKLDWLFTGNGDRWQENTDHLSAGDRAQARSILENLHQGKRGAFDRLLKQAYGLEAADAKRFVEDAGATEQVIALSRDFSPRLPAAQTLGEAFEKIADQAFGALYPSHPRFDPPGDEITARQFETVRGYVEKAVADRDGRVPTMPGADRAIVRRVAGPLRVGKATEDHFLFGEDSFAFWAGVVDRVDATSEGPVTVGALQYRIEALTPPWGLRPEARDLVVAAWALLRGRAWFENGRPVEAPKLGALRESIELRAEELPAAVAWEKARLAASSLFGYTMKKTFLTGANVAEFAGAVRDRATDAAPAVRDLAGRLEKACADLALGAGGSGDRPAVTRRLAEFLHGVHATAGNVAVIDALAELDLPVAETTAGNLLAEAPADSAAMRGFQWPLLRSAVDAQEQPGERGDGAREITAQAGRAFTVVGAPLAEQLSALTRRAVAWVTDPGPTPPPPPVVDPPPPPPGDEADPPVTDPEKVTLRGVDDLDTLQRRLREAVARHGARVHVTWWVE
ncbi:DUF6079 family protein [Tomitella fengzijianii]|uniref:DUF6079 family protein n=1 Tax=Tomitella fengzijianii TaxID=2597660 RepID=UPI00131A7E09|nr:DUF6079 family protein [Tomitella fengzijianii]